MRAALGSRGAPGCRGNRCRPSAHVQLQPHEVAVLVAEPRSLLKTLNPTCTRALERAAGACLTARHYEVTVEHMLLALLDDLESDVPRILEHFEVQPDRVRSAIQRYVGDLRSGNAGKPVFAPLLLELIEDAWVYVST